MSAARTVRKSQVITPFGPGGIYDFGDESFVALDISHWKPAKCRSIRLHRLESVLRVGGFREPPVRPGDWSWGAGSPDYSVPYMRFPTWLFCPKCRSMTRWQWKNEESGKQPHCSDCGKRSRLAPMRFMAVCSEGHLSDVDWVSWAHSARASENSWRCENPKLEFISDAKKGGGLQALSVKCVNCEKSRDLGELSYKDSLRSIGGRCSGRHPWQRHENSQPCDQVPQVVQRGASNAYFPVTVIALDIRSEGAEQVTNHDVIIAHASWSTLKQVYESSTNKVKTDAALEVLLGIVAGGVHVSVDEVWDALIAECGSGTVDCDQGQANEDDLYNDEWCAFTNLSEAGRNAPFVAELADLDNFGASLPAGEVSTWSVFRRLVDSVVLARRIRVVRAFSGFRRLDPSGNKMDPGMGRDMGWLPAVEVYGEGVFLSLSQEELESWEARFPQKYTSGMKHAHEKSGFTYLPEPSPRFVLLHTLAHLLIRQLCFECGYSSASLTERIYCGNGMAGILIYTASSDSEGALGGLVREGEPDRFYGILKTALYRSRWCSSDPICSELPHQGIRGLNRAACHACTLVAETSCTYANALLDRTHIYGKDGVPGYFGPMIDSMES